MKKPILLLILISSFVSNSYSQQVDASIEFPSQDWIQPFPIKITVNKGGDVRGFGKVQLSCDPRLQIRPLSREGGSFVYSNGNIKLLWMDLPPDNVLNITLLVSVPKDMASGEVALSGAFYYMNNEESPSSAVIQAKKFKFSEYGGGELASAPRKAKPDPVAEPAPAPRPVVPKKEKAKPRPAPEPEPEVAAVAEPAPVRPEPAPKPVPKPVSRPAPVAPKPKPTYTPDPVDGVIFRAQVAAQKAYTLSTAVAKRFGLNSELFYDQHESWHKYTTGEFTNYRAAKVFANSLRDSNQVPGSFVVGFEEGTRITIQRAIELTR